MTNVSGGRLVGIILTMGLLAAGTSCTDTPTPPTVAGNPPFPVTPAPVGVGSPGTQVSAAPTTGTVTTPTVTTPVASSPVAGSGVVTTLAGSTQGFADGTGTGAKFDSPDSVVVDSSGNIFVTDTNNDRIRQITPAGVVTTVVGGGQVQATGCSSGSFVNVIGSGFPKAANTAGLAREGSGNLLTSPDGIVLRITTGGAVTVVAGIPGGPGFRDGNACNDAAFASTSGIAVDTNGAIYVADVTRIRKISGGQVTSLTGTAASFGQLRGITIDKDGNLYGADSSDNTIRKITPAGVVTTLAGAAGSGITFADGTGTAAVFTGPKGIVVDSSGNLYVADASTIRKVTAAGVVTTVAGQTGLTGIIFADGTGTAAHFLNPEGIALDSSGNLIVADTGNHRIRKVTL